MPSARVAPPLGRRMHPGVPQGCTWRGWYGGSCCGVGSVRRWPQPPRCGGSDVSVLCIRRRGSRRRRGLQQCGALTRRDPAARPHLGMGRVRRPQGACLGTAPRNTHKTKYRQRVMGMHCPMSACVLSSRPSPHGNIDSCAACRRTRGGRRRPTASPLTCGCCAAPQATQPALWTVMALRCVVGRPKTQVRPHPWLAQQWARLCLAVMAPPASRRRHCLRSTPRSCSGTWSVSYSLRECTRGSGRHWQHAHSTTLACVGGTARPSPLKLLLLPAICETTW